MNLRIVAKILGLLNGIVGAVMALCWLYAHLEVLRLPGNAEAASARTAFAWSTAITLVVAVFLLLAGGRSNQGVLRREAIAIVGLSWIEICLLGSLPYLFCEPGLNVFQSVFESVSGFTTTGASAMEEIESFPRAILLWRALTQWIGGVGILVVFVAVLSFLGVGSRSLVQRESSLNISDSGASRIRDLASTLLLVYLVLSLVCFLGLWALGMTLFDAACHAMSTVATGGFSTRDNSIGHYQSLGIELWTAVFMLLASVSFMIYVFAVRRNWSRLKSEEEARYYLVLCGIACVVVALDLYLLGQSDTLGEGFRSSFFNVISLSTTTGFTVADYDQWPLFTKIVLMLLMVVGGCAGSTAGGLKMNRIILFQRHLVRELIRSFRPYQVFPSRLNGRILDDKVFRTVTFYVALSFTLIGLSTLLIAALEPRLDPLSLMGCVFASLLNAGTGFEATGPSGGFSGLNPATLLLLSFLMILGRLEFFAVLVLFLPSLWKRY